MSLSQHSLWRLFYATFLRIMAGALGITLSAVLLFIVLGALFSAGGSPRLEEEPSVLSMVTCPDATGSASILGHDAPVVWQLAIRGTIGSRCCEATTVRHMVRTIEHYTKDRPLAGVLLLIDSPGGTVWDSSQIRQILLDFKKRHNVPIYAHVESMCCSGGLMIATTADQISACPESIVGSVGVMFGPIFNVAQGLNQWGVEARVLTAGLDKDMGSPYRPWQPDEFRSLEGLMATSYDQFLQFMVEARPLLTKERLRQEIGARIFLGAEAQALGLIDQSNGSRDETLSQLLTKAGVEKAQVIELQTPRYRLEEWLESSFRGFKEVFLPWQPSWLHLARRGPMWIAPCVGQGA